MPRKRVEEEAPPGAPLWSLTYGDFMSLLLCFFIMLLSFHYRVASLEEFLH